MQRSTSNSTIARSLLFATTIGAPLVLGGCVVEPNPYYQPQAEYYNGYSPGVVYATPAPAYYYAPGPAVYIGGGGWHGGGWRR